MIEPVAWKFGAIVAWATICLLAIGVSKLFYAAKRPEDKKFLRHFVMFSISASILITVTASTCIKGFQFGASTSDVLFLLLNELWLLLFVIIAGNMLLTVLQIFLIKHATLYALLEKETRDQSESFDVDTDKDAQIFESNLREKLKKLDDKLHVLLLSSNALTFEFLYLIFVIRK